MQLSVRVIGIEQAQKHLAAQAKKIDPVLRGALNTTATKTRAERYVKPMSASVPGKRLRQSLKIKRANKRWMQSRIIPSSAGIPVLEYKTWGYDPIDKTRGRIWVRGPSGRKVAAGFVNPSSAGKKPLTTRSEKRTARRTYKYKLALQGAMGMSAAYWFKQLSSSQTINWLHAYLQQEFNKRLQKELLK